MKLGDNVALTLSNVSPRIHSKNPLKTDEFLDK